jgi:hypothetical protein
MGVMVTAVFAILLLRLASFNNFYAVNHLFFMPVKRDIFMPDLKESPEIFYTGLIAFDVFDQHFSTFL